MFRIRASRNAFLLALHDIFFFGDLFGDIVGDAFFGDDFFGGELALFLADLRLLWRRASVHGDLVHVRAGYAILPLRPVNLFGGDFFFLFGDDAMLVLPAF